MDNSGYINYLYTMDEKMLKHNLKRSFFITLVLCQVLSVSAFLNSQPQQEAEQPTGEIEARDREINI